MPPLFRIKGIKGKALKKLSDKNFRSETNFKVLFEVFFKPKPVFFGGNKKIFFYFVVRENDISI